MRRRGAEVETAARFYMAGMLAGILAVLLSGAYSAGIFDRVDDVQQLNAAIRAVDGKRVAVLLRAALPNNTRFDANGHAHPLYTLTTVEEEETAEAREMIRAVARRFRRQPIPLDYATHPLTAAYRHRRPTVAQTLIEEWRHPVPGGAPSAEGEADAVMDEVYASALSTEELMRVDISIFVYCQQADLARCRGVHPARRRDASSSRLEAAYQRRYGKPVPAPVPSPYRDTDMPIKVVAPSSTLRAGFWDDPFKPVVAGLLPPRTAVMMNPAYFSNFAEQLAYTLLGHVPGSPLISALAMFATGTVSFFFSVWCAVTTYFLLYRR